jgi:formylglycine-generating enzyme
MPACALLDPLSDLTPRVEGHDAGPSDAPRVEGHDAGPSDAPPPCPVGVGPEMTVIQVTTGVTICVDRTEVTSTQYAAFRATTKDTGPLGSKVPPDCSGISAAGLTPSDDGGNLPRVSISFCSAAFFCAAQGKRLCGALGDGSAVVITESDPDPPMEWEGACANGKSGSYYPWGTTDPGGAVAAKCQTKSAYPDANAPREVGLEPTCGPGSAGPFDMVGNVWEFVNGRKDVDGGVSYTLLRGGAWDGETVPSGCSTGHAIHAHHGTYAGGHATIGFRCCADPS